jgi:hypothetical protein
MHIPRRFLGDKHIDMGGILIESLERELITEV